MSQESKQDKKANNQKIDHSKRKLGKVGLFSAPILMTVGNKPAWAQYCNTDSGRLSGNLSNTENNEPCEIGGEGLTPGWYKSPYRVFNTFYNEDLSFNTAFGCVVFQGADPTQIQVLADNCTDADSYFYKIDDDHCIEGGSNGKKNFRRAVMQLAYQSIAAMQNALSPEINYEYTGLAVREAFCEAYRSGSKSMCETLKNEFDYQNNLGVANLSHSGSWQEPACKS
jgi:hypothetical protein